MKIAVIGTGGVGRTLGTRFASLGHDVVFTARNLESDNMKACLSEAGGKASAAAVSDAVAGADAVLLATQYRDAHAALESAGDLSGKIIIDATNPLKPDNSGLTLGFDTSAGEEIQKSFSGAHVVKCFNTTGFNNMVDPKGATMLVAGDDADAKAKVIELSNALGFASQDAGPLAQSRNMEPFAMLWISLAYRQGLGRDFVLQITPT